MGYSGNKSAAWDQDGDKTMLGEPGKQALRQIEQNQWSIVGRENVSWLSYDTTLLKKFEKTKIGNIHLRAVPLEDWVAYMIDYFTKTGLKKSKLGKNFPRISIHTHKKSDRHNFCINENFEEKKYRKK